MGSSDRAKEYATLQREALYAEMDVSDFWGRISRDDDPTMAEIADNPLERQIYSNIDMDRATLNSGLVLWIGGLGIATIIGLWGSFSDYLIVSIIGLLASLFLIGTATLVGLLQKIYPSADALYVDSLQLGIIESKRFPETLFDGMWSSVRDQVEEIKKWAPVAGLSVMACLFIFGLFLNGVLDVYNAAPDGIIAVFAVAIAQLSLYAIAAILTAVDRLKRGARIIGRLVGQQKLKVDEVEQECLVTEIPELNITKTENERAETKSEKPSTTYDQDQPPSTSYRRHNPHNFFGKKLPNWVLIFLLIMAGAAAVAGPILKDTITGTTTLVVSQSIMVDQDLFGPDSVQGDVDLANVFVWNDGHAWSVHVETNNGGTFTIDLPLANEADQPIVVELRFSEQLPFNITVDPMIWWSDADHNGMLDRDELTLVSEDDRLDRSDEVSAPGLADLRDFDENIWFFDSSGIYGIDGYNDDAFSDSDGETPEAILLDDGDGFLDPGPLFANPDRLLTPGRASLAEDNGPYASSYEAVGKFFFIDNPGGRAGTWDLEEDIFLNQDGDGFFTIESDNFIDGDGYATSGPGGKISVMPGTELSSFKAIDNLYWHDGDSSGNFNEDDAIWVDNGGDGYFNGQGQSVTGPLASTHLKDIFDGSIGVAFDGHPLTTYNLENSGHLHGGSLSMVGLLEVAPLWADRGSLVTVGSQANPYLVTDRSPDNGPGSTLTLLGDVTTAGQDLKGEKLHEMGVVVDGAPGVYVNGSQAVGSDGRWLLQVDDGTERPVDASSLDGNQFYILDSDGLLNGNEIPIIIDADAGPAATQIQILGLPDQGIPDNYQFFTVQSWQTQRNLSVDSYYLESADEIVAALQTTLGASAQVGFDDPGFSSRYRLQSLTTRSDSSVVVKPGDRGTDLSTLLAFGQLNGGHEAGPDQIIRGAPLDDLTFGQRVETDSHNRFSYSDNNDDGQYQPGELIFEEETGGSGSYSSLADELIYTGSEREALGGAPGLLGSQAYPMLDGDNIMYLDRSQNGEYDFEADKWEPLIHTGTADIDPGGVLTSQVTVLPRYGGSWPSLSGMDMFRLENDFNGVNRHLYQYVDASHNRQYDDGEVIVDMYGGRNLLYIENLQSQLLHSGQANLMRLVANPTDVNRQNWTFYVPDSNSLGSPLFVRITVELPADLPSGIYEIQSEIVPVRS